MCIFWNMPRETMCIKLCMLCLTSYLYFSEHPRTIQINCEEFTWHCAIASTWNVNCINLFCSALVERIFVLFYQLFALREENQTRFELSSEVFDEIETVSPTVSPFVACKKRHNLCMNHELLDCVSWNRTTHLFFIFSGDIKT